MKSRRISLVWNLTMSIDVGSFLTIPGMSCRISTRGGSDEERVLTDLRLDLLCLVALARIVAHQARQLGELALQLAARVRGTP